MGVLGPLPSVARLPEERRRCAAEPGVLVLLAAARGYAGRRPDGEPCGEWTSVVLLGLCWSAAPARGAETGRARLASSLTSSLPPCSPPSSSPPAQHLDPMEIEMLPGTSGARDPRKRRRSHGRNYDTAARGHGRADAGRERPARAD